MEGDIYQIGDRVRYVFHRPGGNHTGSHSGLDGYTGTIVANCSHYYHIEFDKKIPSGHSCNGIVKDGFGYSVSPIFLELIEKKEPERIRWYKNGKLSPYIIEDKPKPKYNDIITDDDFREFLIDYGAYDEYIMFAKNFNIIKPQEYIGGAFSWPKSKSGRVYWENINIKWLTHLKKRREKL